MIKTSAGFWLVAFGAFFFTLSVILRAFFSLGFGTHVTVMIGSLFLFIFGCFSVLKDDIIEIKRATVK